jgi:formylglycine-generating enzyme required for sulfatase activity
VNQERWNRAKSIFSGATRLPPFLRRAWVWVACRSDKELRREVLRLLENALREDSFLDFASTSAEQRLPHPPPTPAVLPDLELIERVGQGGMGVVWRARQRSMNRTVAVKVLPDLLAVSESRRRAFQNESEIVGRLSHPNIVPVYVSGLTESLAYYVMEFVEGKSLADRLLDQRETPRPDPILEPAGVARFIADVANALSAAHAAKIAHRDIKPANILVTPDGTPKLVDFGLARPLDKVSLSSRIVGTLNYMSPEQARLREAPVDHRTDIYSLGVVMYEMLTLARPFDGRTIPEILIKIREREPLKVRKLNPAVPRDLETICHKAMRKLPEQRYASAAELEADLLAFLEHRSPVAQPPSLIERAQAGLERHRAVALGLALAAIIAPAAWWAIERVVTAAWVRSRLAALPAEASRRADGIARSSSPDMEELAARFRMDRQWLEDAHAVREADARLTDSDVERLQQAERVATADLEGVRDALIEHIAAEQQANRSSAAGAHPSHLSTAIALLGMVLEVLGDPHPEDTLAGLMLPRITLRTSPPGATVFARRLDPCTGIVLDANWSRLGTSDLVSHSMLSGYWHFVAVTEAGPYGEFADLVEGPGVEHELPTLVLRAPDEEGPAMARVPCGDYEVSEGERGNRDGVGLATLGAKAPIGAFLIDRFETTNAEFRAYCEATGRPTPDVAALPDAHVDRLPVVKVDFHGVEAYAAWLGKRLLFKAEWNRAAGRTLPTPSAPPWKAPADADSILDRANMRPPQWRRTLSPNISEYEVEDYLLHARPVGSFPGGQSIEGVHDLLGNVWEWTASMSANEVRPGRFRPEPGTRLTVGGCYQTPPDIIGFDAPILSHGGGYTTGIRLGRTAPEELPRP